MKYQEFDNLEDAKTLVELELLDSAREFMNSGQSSPQNTEITRNHMLFLVSGILYKGSLDIEFSGISGIIRKASDLEIKEFNI